MPLALAPGSAFADTTPANRRRLPCIADKRANSLCVKRASHGLRQSARVRDSEMSAPWLLETLLNRPTNQKSAAPPELASGFCGSRTALPCYVQRCSQPTNNQQCQLQRTDRRRGSFCRTSKMSHGCAWRDSCASTRRDKRSRWLWRLVRPLDHKSLGGSPSFRKTRSGKPNRSSRTTRFWAKKCRQNRNA